MGGRRSKERRRLGRKVWKGGGEEVKKEGDWVGRCGNGGREGVKKEGDCIGRCGRKGEKE